MRPASLILIAVLLLAGGLGLYLATSGGSEKASTGAAAPELVEEEAEEEREPVAPRTPEVTTRRDVEARPKVIVDELTDVRGDPTDANRLRVVGSVVDSKGEPLRGIRVQLGPSKPGAMIALDAPDYPSEFFNQIQRTTSDKDGQFEWLIDLDVALWTLAIRAPGYGNVDQFEIQLPSAGFFALSKTVLSQAVEISGRVLDSEGIAVPGAVLLSVRDRGLDAEEPRFLPSSPLEVTDAKGSFHITSFPAGLVQLIVQSDDHPEFHYTGISASPGTHLTNRVFHLEDMPLTCTLTGIITTSSGPLAGATVRVYPNSSDALDDETVYEAVPAAPHTQTDEKGAYQLERLDLGTCTISVEHPNYQLRQIWTIRLQESNARCNLTLEDHSLSGWIRDVDGNPLEGAQLRVERVRQNASKTGYRLVAGTSIPEPDRLAIVNHVSSDADGHYVIDGLDSSTGLVLTAELPWHATKQSKVFAFQADQPTRETNLTLEPGGLIRANVTLAAFNQDDYRLRATPIDQPGYAITSTPLDPESYLELGYLPAGRYLVELFIPSSDTTPIEIIESVEKTIEAGLTLTLYFSPQ